MKYPVKPIIGVAREGTSPENRLETDPRVALLPSEVSQISQCGFKVIVEEAAGRRMHISDSDYVEAGASIATKQQVYASADLLVKFKGPDHHDVSLMRPGSTMFCMAHVKSYPQRQGAFQKAGVTLVGMERLLEANPIVMPDEIVGTLGAVAGLQTFSLAQANILVIGYNFRLAAAIRHAARLHVKSIRIIQAEQMDANRRLDDDDLLIITDKGTARIKADIRRFYPKSRTVDLHEIEQHISPDRIKMFATLHCRPRRGIRRVQCFHQTGSAAADYAVDLFHEHAEHKRPNHTLTAAVLGYGLLASGAIQALHSRGIGVIHILGRRQTAPMEIKNWLADSDLILNGAEARTGEKRRFLITNAHCHSVIKSGSILVDMIGGTQDYPSPVEPIPEARDPRDPHFKYGDILLASAWGWGIVNRAEETNKIYSRQIFSVLTGEEKLAWPPHYWADNAKDAIIVDFTSYYRNNNCFITNKLT